MPLKKTIFYCNSLPLKKWALSCQVGCRAILVLLLRHGAKVTAVDGHNVTPLGIAAEYAHAEVLDILIKNGTSQSEPLDCP